MILDSIETREKILAEFLQVCAFEGWNNDALRISLEKCGIDPKFSTLIFENGCLDLAEFYIESGNKKAAQKISRIENFAGRKIRDKIRLALYSRFEVEEENKIALQRLTNFYLNPKNLTSFETGPRPMIQALNSCYKIADFIWREINDQSTDFNFYTKRLTLGKIILRSIFVFVKDDSENSQTTKKFIDEQIEKVMKFEKFKAQVKGFTNRAKHECNEFLFDEHGELKSPKKILKSLPFIRLIKF